MTATMVGTRRSLEDMLRDRSNTTTTTPSYTSVANELLRQVNAAASAVAALPINNSSSHGNSHSDPKKKRFKPEMPLLLQDCPMTHRQLLDMLYTLDFDDHRNGGCGGKACARPLSCTISREGRKAAAIPTAARNCTSSSTDQGPKVLPPDLAARVVSFLTVQPVDPNRLTAQCCSSHDGVHRLQEAVSDSENTWWLARSGTMPDGKGREYVQFALKPKVPVAEALCAPLFASSPSTLCRLRYVRIKIPTLPLGPLSVREFHLETFDLYRGWRPITPTFCVNGNHEGWQTFAVPGGGRDVSEVRVVCTSNQMAPYLEKVDWSSDLVRTRHPSLARDMQRFASVGFFSIGFE